MMQKYYVAKLDCKHHYPTADVLGITEFPTFKMFDHDRAMAAKDGKAPALGHTEKTFIQWIKRTAGIIIPTMT